jgi:hypothetical protein
MATHLWAGNGPYWGEVGATDLRIAEDVPQSFDVVDLNRDSCVRRFALDYGISGLGEQAEGKTEEQPEPSGNAHDFLRSER